MNKILANWKYRTAFQAKWMGVGISIYIALISLTFAILIHFRLIHPGEGTLVYRMFFLLTVLFAMTMRFKEDFNYMLTLSNTRKTIFISFSLSAVFLSAVTTVLIVLERLIIDGLNKALNLYKETDPFHAFAPYASDNLAAMALFMFVGALAMCAFALLSGSLFYRFGKVFTAFYWIILSAVPTVVFPLILWIAHIKGHFMETWTNWGYSLSHFNLITASAVLLLLTALFTVASYLNIRRLPQK